MTQSATRPFTRHEKTVLRSYLGQGTTGIGERLFGAIMLFCLLTVALAAAGQFFKNRCGLPSHLENPFAVVMVILALACSVILYVRLGRNKTPAGRLFHADFKNGIAFVHTFTAKDAVRVEEFEDVGQAVYLDISEGKVLFLMGPYLSEMLDKRHFPCRQFEVAYAPQSRLVLDVICKGEYLAPSRILPAFSERDFRSNRMPDDGAVLDIDFATIRDQAV